ncbi:MAG: hypothetical protein GXO96_10230, partial [Nitrospirae bacterium]|nr:hypothetical protein [Candidatus Manganitrophaceae bacterium]
DPVTPTIVAHAGDPVRIHVFGAFNEQNQMFSLEGHQWPLKINMPGADQMHTEEFGSSENLDVFVRAAGGPTQLPGIYLWQNHRLPYTAAGQWGYFKVLPAGSQSILPLNSGGGMGGRTAEAPTEKAPEVLSGGSSAPGPLSMLDK